MGAFENMQSDSEFFSCLGRRKKSRKSCAVIPNGAMGICTPVITLTYAFGYFFGQGGAALYSIAKGQNDMEKARIIHNTDLCAMLIFGIVVLIEIPVLLLEIFTTCYVNNDGHPEITMLAAIFGVTSNVALNFLFVYGFDWGMFGAALATVFCSFLGAYCGKLCYRRCGGGSAPHQLSYGQGNRKALWAFVKGSILVASGLGLLFIIIGCGCTEKPVAIFSNDDPALSKLIADCFRLYLPAFFIMGLGICIPAHIFRLSKRRAGLLRLCSPGVSCCRCALPLFSLQFSAKPPSGSQLPPRS